MSRSFVRTLPLTALGVAVGVLVALAPGAAQAAPFCGQVWGSLPEADARMGADPIDGVRAGRHACFDQPGASTWTGAAGGSGRALPAGAVVQRRLRRRRAACAGARASRSTARAGGVRRGRRRDLAGAVPRRGWPTSRGWRTFRHRLARARSRARRRSVSACGPGCRSASSPWTDRGRVRGSSSTSATAGEPSASPEVAPRWTSRRSATSAGPRRRRASQCRRRSSRRTSGSGVCRRPLAAAASRPGPEWWSRDRAGPSASTFSPTGRPARARPGADLPTGGHPGPPDDGPRGQPAAPSQTATPQVAAASSAAPSSTRMPSPTAPRRSARRCGPPSSRRAGGTPSRPARRRSRARGRRPAPRRSRGWPPARRRAASCWHLRAHHHPAGGEVLQHGPAGDEDDDGHQHEPAGRGLHDQRPHQDRGRDQQAAGQDRQQRPEDPHEDRDAADQRDVVAQGVHARTLVADARRPRWAGPGRPRARGRAVVVLLCVRWCRSVHRGRGGLGGQPVGLVGDRGVELAQLRVVGPAVVGAEQQLSRRNRARRGRRPAPRTGRNGPWR